MRERDATVDPVGMQNCASRRLERSAFHDGRRIMRRYQLKADKVLGERLIKEAQLAREGARLAREKAEQLPTDEEREALLKKAREADIKARVDEWLNTPVRASRRR